MNINFAENSWQNGKGKIGIYKEYCKKYGEVEVQSKIKTLNLGNLGARKCWRLSILIKIETYALEHKGIIKITERKQEMGVKGQKKMKCGNYTQ